MTDKKIYQPITANKSDEVQDILEAPHPWLLRWGTLSVLVGFVILFGLTVYIDYPDTISSEIRIATTEPTIRLVSGSSGYISKLGKKSGDTLQAGELIAVLGFKREFMDVLTLHNQINQIQTINDTTLLRFALPPAIYLGEIQTYYDVFLEKQEALRLLAEPRPATGVDPRLQASLIQQAKQAITSFDNEQTQLQTEKQTLIAQYNKDRSLYENGAISRFQLEQSAARLQDIERRIQSNESSTRKKQYEIRSLQQPRNAPGIRPSGKARSNAVEGLSKAFIDMRNGSDQWVKQYLIISPIEGILSYLKEDLRQDMYVENSEYLFSVTPTKRTNMLGRVFLQSISQSSIQPGQEALVKLQDYPAQEYGVLQGRVNRISVQPTEEQTIIEIIFPRRDTTSNDRTLRPAQYYEGRVEFLVSDKKLIQWFIEKL